MGDVAAKMVTVNEGFPIAAPLDGVDEEDRVAAIARLHDLFSTGELSLERFSELLEKVFAAPGHADLEAAMSTLPPLVRLTPTSRRLTKPLVLRAADGGLQLGSGWQLAADTTISTGFGAARVDLTAASWDSCQINLHLETWGSIDVLVPEGVAVQMLGGSGHVHLESLSAPSHRGTGIAHFHVWTDRGDPYPPSEGAQRRVVHALETASNRRTAQVRGDRWRLPTTAALVASAGWSHGQPPGVGKV